MENRPFVSVVVISYNGADVIETCLETLFANDYPAFEVVVVNNGSVDGTPQIVEENFPRARLVNVYPNRGYAGGMNEGLKVCRGEILIPFNDDTESTPNLISEMVRPLEEDPSVGIVGCKILYPDRQTLQHAGGEILPTGLTRHIGYMEKDEGQHDQRREVDYVTGCAAAIRRSLFEKLGLYDDRYYPTYFEEVEFCWRARRIGVRVIYQPTAVLYHYESKTEVKYSRPFLYRVNRSRLRFVLKNFPLRSLPGVLVKEFRWFLSRDRDEAFGPLLRAYLSTLLRLPMILYDRRYRFLDIGQGGR
jgi:GT2 family glycosyltransferase